MDVKNKLAIYKKQRKIFIDRVYAEADKRGEWKKIDKLALKMSPLPEGDVIDIKMAGLLKLNKLFSPIISDIDTIASKYPSRWVGYSLVTYMAQTAPDKLKKNNIRDEMAKALYEAYIGKDGPAITRTELKKRIEFDYTNQGIVDEVDNLFRPLSPGSEISAPTEEETPPAEGPQNDEEEEFESAAGSDQEEEGTASASPEAASPATEEEEASPAEEDEAEEGESRRKDKQRVDFEEGSDEDGREEEGMEEGAQAGPSSSSDEPRGKPLIYEQDEPKDYFDLATMNRSQLPDLADKIRTDPEQEKKLFVILGSRKANLAKFYSALGKQAGKDFLDGRIDETEYGQVMSLVQSKQGPTIPGKFRVRTPHVLKTNNRIKLLF